MTGKKMAKKKSKKSKKTSRGSKGSKSAKKKSGGSKTGKKGSKGSTPGKKGSAGSKPDKPDPDDLTRLNIAIPERTPGRRASLTPEIQQALVTVIQAGNYNITACNFVGVAESTFYRWMQRGEDEIKRLIEVEEETGEYLDPDEKEAIYVQFWESIKKAESTSEVTALMHVKRSFGEDWKSAMTFLERKKPDHWRRRDRTELTDPDGNPVAVVVYLPDNNRGKKPDGE